MVNIGTGDFDFSLPGDAELEEMKKKDLKTEEEAIAKNTKELRELTDPSDIEIIYLSFESRINSCKDLAPKYMDAMEEGFKNKNNDRASFKAGYDVIDRIVDVNPELAKKGHDMIVRSLLNENHKKDSIQGAKTALERLEYRRPELRAKEYLFDAPKDASGKTFYTVNKDALTKVSAVKSEVLRNIIKNKEKAH